jgi:hypothetical protein
MSKFIELTSTSGSVVLINFDLVECVSQDEVGNVTRIIAKKHIYEVLEVYEVVRLMLKREDDADS